MATFRPTMRAHLGILASSILALTACGGGPSNRQPEAAQPSSGTGTPPTTARAGQAPGATASTCPGASLPAPAAVDGCAGVMPADLGPAASFLAAEPETAAACESTVVDQSGNIAVA